MLKKLKKLINDKDFSLPIEQSALNLVCEGNDCSNVLSVAIEIDGELLCQECANAMKRRNRLSQGFGDETEEEVLDIVSKLD